jgi:hypothetical protein
MRGREGGWEGGRVGGREGGWEHQSREQRHNQPERSSPGDRCKPCCKRGIGRPVVSRLKKLTGERKKKKKDNTRWPSGSLLLIKTDRNSQKVRVVAEPKP